MKHQGLVAIYMECIFSLWWVHAFLSSQDMRCVGETPRGTWGHVVPFVPVKSFWLGKRASPTCPNLLIMSYRQVAIELGWVQGTATRYVVGRLLDVNSCFLIRWCVSCHLRGKAQAMVLSGKRMPHLDFFSFHYVPNLCVPPSRLLPF